MYQNIENGNILTYSEMISEAKEFYDWGDDTNDIPLSEYYKKIKDPE